MKSEEFTSTTDTENQVRVPATKSQKFNWLKSLCRDTTMSSTAKVVAFVLADHHNDETGQCNPSQQRIADSAGVGIRTISRAIADLKAGGWITAKENYYASDYVLKIARHGTEDEAEDMSELRRTGRTPYVAPDVHTTSCSTYPLRQERRTNLSIEPQKRTTQINLKPAEQGGPCEIEHPAKVQIAPDTNLGAIPSTTANDDQPELGEVVRFRGLTIPHATFLEWEETYRYLDVRAQLADLAKWICKTTPEESSRLRILASMLLKRNQEAHREFLTRKADTEGRASALLPAVATSRFQFLTDAEGNTISGGPASAVPVVRPKSRFQI